MRIVGGFEAGNGQFPHQARMLAPVSSTSSQVCGGSVLTEDFVLTAAHCTSGLGEFRMGFGSNDFNDPQVTIISFSKLEHPQYNGLYLNNDLSLIALPQRLTFSSTIAPIPLPRRSQTDETFVNERVVASGYGLTANGGAISPKLNYVYLRVIGNAECLSFYGSSVVQDSTICTRGGDRNEQSTCQGDSGGPIITEDKTLIGVTSFVSSRGCDAGDPSGFARVSKYLDWIGQNTGVQIRP
jgi:secreted trypsin-like serine protease